MSLVNTQITEPVKNKGQHHSYATKLTTPPKNVVKDVHKLNLRSYPPGNSS